MTLCFRRLITERWPVERLTKRSRRSSSGSNSFLRSPPQSIVQIPRPAVWARKWSTPARMSAVSLTKSVARAEISFCYSGVISLPSTPAPVTLSSQ